MHLNVFNLVNKVCSIILRMQNNCHFRLDNNQIHRSTRVIIKVLEINLSSSLSCARFFFNFNFDHLWLYHWWSEQWLFMRKSCRLTYTSRFSVHFSFLFYHIIVTGSLSPYYSITVQHTDDDDDVSWNQHRHGSNY